MMGRKSKLNDELIKKVKELLVQGNCITWVCDYVGISTETFFTWRKAGEADKEEGKHNLKVVFSDTVKEARAQAQIEHVANIKRACYEDPKWSAWFLERSDPKNWGQKTYNETKFEGKIEQKITDMTDEELHDKAAEILKRRALDTE